MKFACTLGRKIIRVACSSYLLGAAVAVAAPANTPELYDLGIDSDGFTLLGEQPNFPTGYVDDLSRGLESNNWSETFQDPSLSNPLIDDLQKNIAFLNARLPEEGPFHVPHFIIFNYRSPDKGPVLYDWYHLDDQITDGDPALVSGGRTELTVKGPSGTLEFLKGFHVDTFPGYLAKSYTWPKEGVRGTEFELADGALEAPVGNTAFFSAAMRQAYAEAQGFDLKATPHRTLSVEQPRWYLRADIYPEQHVITQCRTHYNELVKRNICQKRGWNIRQAQAMMLEQEPYTYFRMYGGSRNRPLGHKTAMRRTLATFSGSHP